MASIGAWATSRTKEEAPAARAERWGIFVGLWAPTFMEIGNALKAEEAVMSSATRERAAGGVLASHPGAALIALAAFVSFVLSVSLWFADSREEALFVGLWVPSILPSGALRRAERWALVTAGLLVAGILVTAMVAVGLWLMERAGVEPAARANGLAPDPTEETEVRRSAPRGARVS
ncbi:MAG: hypothetical protein WKF40_07820 [Thermoleophilaceae bacterium]